MKWKVFSAGTPDGRVKSPEEGLELIAKEKLGNEVAFTPDPRCQGGTAQRRIHP